MLQEATMEIIVPPSGMKYDLARKLVQDDCFAHMWLVHPDGGKCPDGCDSHGDSARVAVYQGIKVYHTSDTTRAYMRGRSDAKSYRAPLFRSTRDHGIRSEMDDHMSDMWDDDMRQAYLDGYNAG
jgi:hypothetical protein